MTLTLRVTNTTCLALPCLYSSTECLPPSLFYTVPVGSIQATPLQYRRRHPDLIAASQGQTPTIVCLHFFSTSCICCMHCLVPGESSLCSSRIGNHLVFK
ncbi:hypothetical protein NEOLEDRAFT_143593 [Neolentinus lepideus HHB14362 ss-1]|uniref:Uncharacterized protein n=1 Tax=Neolentinus lepideus HHB14362 ss-1 TaxID=1314782 RepID=A0A165U0E0_9AGAM|nr:hypothetical protein NEOLEDRAFT_143593 [Neolentinus lepideus HHB14362 ss-1]